MKPFYADLDHNSDTSLYVQLYELLRAEILNGGFSAGERLPSLRSLSDQLEISVTTCAKAYDQLMLEGYLDAKPQSGYYVQKLDPAILPYSGSPTEKVKAVADSGSDINIPAVGSAGFGQYRVDPECFDFSRWRKCFNRVMSESDETLLTPQDPQGEFALRKQISEYLYSARGVSASPEDIVIGAGVQQLTSRLAKILMELGIDFVNLEDPGYKPVRHIFRDFGFTLNMIPVAPDGLEIERLPVNIGTAVYVSPSNQFPTGSVMPAARRYQLLEWAGRNGSVIIEDDYDSELRYFGNPIPALKNMDSSGRVVYLGSFSSTLFPAIRISYMVLPEMLSSLFRKSLSDYDQTCSKIEQLVLAEYMRCGFYQSGIRKLRKLYARKLDRLIDAFREYGGDTVSAQNTRSGITIRLTVRSSKSPADLCRDAESLRLHMVPVYSASKVSGTDSGISRADAGGDCQLLLYYDQIPIAQIDSVVRSICEMWAFC